MGEEASTVRLVRCPKCENLLPELPQYSVYQCGGCGAVLQGKHSTPAATEKRALENSSVGSGSVISEKLDNVNLEDNSQIGRESHNSGLDKTKGRIIHEKVTNLNSSSSSRTEKRESFIDSDQSRRRRLNFDQNKVKVIDNNYRREHRSWDLNGHRYGSLADSYESHDVRNPFEATSSRPVSIHRNSSVVEKGRFGNLPYPSEGPSSSNLGPFQNFGEQIRKRDGLNGLSRVEDLENNKAELLKTLDELKDQLNRSCNVADKRNGRQRSSYHDFSIFNHYPTLRNSPSEYVGYEDAFRSQVLQRPPHHIPHQPSRRQYPPPTYYDHFHGYNQDPILSYSRDTFFHQPTCSCSQCYNMKWQPIPPKVAPPAAFNSQEPNYPILDHVAYGPSQLPHHRLGSLNRSWISSGDLDLGNGGFRGRHPRRRVIITRGGERVAHPISGGAPFIACRNCFKLLKIPGKLMLLGRNNHRTMKCGGCSALISFSMENKGLVASVSSPRKQQSTGDLKSNRSLHSSYDYDISGYEFLLTDSEVTEKNLPSIEAEKIQDSHVSSSSISEDEQSPDSAFENSSPPLPYVESNSSSDKNVVSQNGKGNKSPRTDQEKVIIDDGAAYKQKFLKDASVETEMDVSLNDYLSSDVANHVEVNKEDDSRNSKGNDSFFAGLIKKRFRDFSRSSSGSEKVRWNVSVNGHVLTDRVVKKAEKLAGPIQPGDYWYDYLAGFWGVMNQPCLGIIPPFIDEFNHPMPENCAAGNTGVLVNGRELNKKDLDLLASRGLPTTKGKSYIIDISGKVVDEDTGEELDSLGKLAPTVERVKHGFGMKVPQSSSK